MFDRITGGRFTSVPRGDLAALIYGALDDGVATIFDVGIAAIDHVGSEVRVRFERSPSRALDLVIGADGHTRRSGASSLVKKLASNATSP